MKKLLTALPAVNKHFRALITRVIRRRPDRFVIAFIAVAILATAFGWTRGRAAANGFHWPAALTRIFASRTTPTLSPPPPAPPAGGPAYNVAAPRDFVGTVLPTSALKYRSKTSGNWSDFNTWQVSSDGGVNFVDAIAGQTPTSADDTIQIQSPHVVTVTAPVTVDQVTVDSGGTLATAAVITNSGTMNVNGTFQINTGGAITTTAPTYGGGLSTLKYNHGGVYSRGTEWNATSGAGFPHYVQISNSTTLDLGAGGTGTARSMAGTLTIDSGSALSMDNGANKMTAALSIGSLANSGTLTLSSLSGGDLNVIGGGFANSSTFTANGRTVTFNTNGSGNTQTISGTNAFANLTINHTDVNSVTAAGSTLSVTGLLDVVSGTFTSATDYQNVQIDPAGTLVLSGPITVSGNWTNNGTFTSNGQPVTFNGTSAQSINGSSTTAFSDFTDSNTSAAVTFNTNFNVSGTFNMNGAGTLFTPGSPSVQINSAGNAGTITGTGRVQVTRLSSNPFSSQYRLFTFNVTALTVEWAGAGDQNIENGVSGYGGIMTSGSGTKTIGGSGTLAVNGDVTIGSGTTLAQGSNSLNVAGNWSNSGTFTAGTSEVGVTFKGAGNTQTISGTNTFSNLTINHTGGGSVTAAGSTLAVTGLLRVQSGTFTSATSYVDVTIDAAGTLALSGPITVSGNWTNNGGTFTPGTNGVSFNGATGQTITGDTSFYDFTKSVAAAQQFNFTAGSTTTVTHSLTLTGASGQLLTLRSTGTPTQWKLNAPTTQSVSYVDVKDSDASGGSNIAPTNSTDSGHNINWLFPPTLGTYPDTSVALSADGTVAPGAAPTNTTSINVSSSTNFKGTFFADPATGVVRVTDAHPAGTYTVTVTAFNGSVSVTRTFTLTVQTGTACTGASIFTNAADSSVGSNAVSVAIGDFNNDGNQDIATANYNGNTVSIRLGNGDGTLTAATDVSVGSGPYSVAIGDFNNDGKQDIATANYNGNTVSIRLGNGDGTFTAATDVSVGSAPHSVAVGDFNNDGKQDIAAANLSSNTVSIRLGDGLGGFSGSTNVSVGSGPFSVAIGDFNGDGKQDIAAANSSSGTVSIRLGDGSGGFSGSTNVSVGSGPFSVAIGDFNNDGKQDIAVANSSSSRTVSIRLGNGDGTFTGSTNVSVGSLPFSVAIGDFNNDGKQDIAAANSSSGTVSIRVGNGDGTFSGTTNLSVGTYLESVAIGDFNGDGKQDIVAGNIGSNSISIRLGACNLPPTIAAATGLSRQQGSPVSNSQIATVTDDGGNGSVTVTVTSANPSNGVTISNIVNTGGNITANIVASCTASNATFTLQASDGSSTATDTLTVTINPNSAPTLTYSSPQSVVFGGALNVSPTSASDNGTITGYAVQAGHGLTTAPTVDSSGVVSITNAQPAGTHTITVRATDNCGAFTDATFTLEVQPQPPTLGTYPDTSVALGADATVTPGAAPTNTTSINVSSSTNFKGTFFADPATGVVHVTNAHPAGTFTVTVKAFNGPIVNTTKTFTLTVQTGTACTGVSSFTSAADLSVGYAQSAAIGDFNNDGKQDIAVAVSSSSYVSIRLGNGAGGFAVTTSVSVGANPHSVAIGDFNNDGNQDLAAANAGSNTVSIRLGDGSGGFTGTTNVSVGSFPQSVAIGDFNNDGKQDIAVVNVAPNTVSIRLGDGLGGFAGTTNISVGTEPWSVAIGDFNNDGKQDLAVANLLSSTVSICLGDGAGGFTGTTSVSAGSYPYSVAIGDFNNDGKQDIAVANDGSSTVSIRLGDGSGGFAGTTEIGVGASPFSVAIGDFNNDGKQDIAVASYSSNTVSIRLGDGLGAFTGTTNVSVGTNPFLVVIGDFNNDGKQDFATPNYESGTVSIRLGQCNPAPTIAAATGLSRQQGSPAGNSQIATVTDDGGNGSVNVTVTSTNPSNGVTLSNIANTGGNITANIVADCTATTAAFTLQASDGSSTATDTLTVTVNPNTAPTLVYASPQSAVFGGALNVSPTSASDNGTITGYAVQAGHGLTTAPTVDASGVVSITNAQPAGAHTVTIRATDNCGAFTDAAFTLNVGAMPTFAIDDVAHNEGNAGTTSYTFTVTKTGSTALNSSVNFATVDGSATTANSDYQANTGTLTFLPADTTKTITVLVNGDTTFEADEAFTVHLSGASSATISDADGTGTITNDDSAPTFAIDDVTHNEGNAGTTSYTFTVTKTGSTALSSSVNFATVDGSATTANSDYQANSGTLNFGPTDTTKTITVLGNGDTTFESDEAFTVHLSGASSATISDADGTGTITNDDSAPTFAIDDVTHNEGNAGTTSYTFTVTKTGSTALSSSVNFATVDGSATTANNDYQANSGTLTFLPTDTTKTITVLGNGDTTFESDEAFTVHLSGASSATISDADGTGTITNDDSAPTFAIDDVAHNEGNAGTTSYTFTVTKTGSTALSSSVNSTTVDGTATTVNNDYQLNTGALNFLATDTTKQITVLVNGDTTVEPDEAFTVHLSGASGATISDADGTGTITNDDVAPPSPTPTPTPTASPIQLILDESGPAPDQVAALDAVLFLRDPFPVVNGAALLSLGLDRNTRVMIFVTNLQLAQVETSSAVVVNLIDSNGQVYDVTAEDVRPVPDFDCTQVIFRLPDNLPPGACTIRVKAHGQTSNSGTIRIRT